MQPTSTPLWERLKDRPRRSTSDLDRHYRAIGISAVAAAVRHPAEDRSSQSPAPNVKSVREHEDA
jgi:hypothetical protein